MRKSTCCVLVMLFGSWLSSLGQSAPKATFPRVVATFHQYGLTDALPPTTIYTPKNGARSASRLSWWGSRLIESTPCGQENFSFWMQQEKTFRLLLRQASLRTCGGLLLRNFPSAQKQAHR
jgi:hypothetical protein